MHSSPEEFLEQVSTGLGLYYLLLCAMNWVAALLVWRKGPKVYFNLFGVPVTNLLTWFFVGLFFIFLSPLAMIGQPVRFSPVIKDAVNWASGPVVLTVGSLIGLWLLFVFRRYWTPRPIAWTLLNLSLLAMGMAMTDPNFTSIVAKPDNVPIVALVYLLGFFTWVATHRAVENDDRRRQGLPPIEKLDDEKILVWPDLVYTELVCMIAITAILLLWGIGLQAPLEEPASAVKTPNPSKAPWYFLGLQEMLVYFDPWMAGVVLPSVVLAGLMAIPYLDFNKQGNGYYTIEERKFSYIVFQLGFLELWIVLIVLGTFLRGPNWNFFGPFEAWDAHKLTEQNNVNLSEYFWIRGLNRSLPSIGPGEGWLHFFKTIGVIVVREAPGILLLLGYFFLLPPIMAATVFRKFFVKMGFIRYMVMINLLLMMAVLPIKMMLRWVFNLKYIVSISEYFLNF